jgi:hypothetical protein
VLIGFEEGKGVGMFEGGKGMNYDICLFAREARWEGAWNTALNGLYCGFRWPPKVYRCFGGILWDFE